LKIILLDAVVASSRDLHRAARTGAFFEWRRCSSSEGIMRILTRKYHDRPARRRRRISRSGLPFSVLLFSRGRDFCRDLLPTRRWAERPWLRAPYVGTASFVRRSADSSCVLRPSSSAFSEGTTLTRRLPRECPRWAASGNNLLRDGLTYYFTC